jgi:cation diffusion facilitator CzcD-associated flavoprotein CzcO
VTRRAVIIGAGGAGLSALHAMQDAGFEARAFEQHDELGGVWATTLYPSLTIHSRSFNYRFHDFPPMASRGPCATRDEVRAYLAAYVAAKAIADKITYRTRVERVVVRTATSRERCVVETTTGTHACDVVVCATGFASAGRPHVPELAGRAASRVTVVHSGALTPAMVDDIIANRRKVVVLGAGKSAHEILLLLRDAAATWVYAKSLWAFSYERLYGAPWNVPLYLYYLQLAGLRRRHGYGRVMRALQAPLRWSGMVVNPLERDTDVCRNRFAIMKREQLAHLRTVATRKASATALVERGVVLDTGEVLDADYLVCATGYDRRHDLPAVVVEDAAGKQTPHALAAQHGFYREMVDPAVPEVSLLAANSLYLQQLLGYSLGAQWLARFHAGTLRPHPTPAHMRRGVAADAAEFAPWCADEYLSHGLPYAHERKEEVLPELFEDMGLSRGLARKLVISAASEAAFGRVCDDIARRLARH